MSDKIMQTLAQLQTENRKLKQQDKLKDQKLNQRDEAIRLADTEYKKSLDELKEQIKFKDKMIKSLTKKKGKK
tara:strand:- start:517 stop:735 length:219 start_codon:yes stop_codon:yes gene_type:complete